jgi:hypothetical protein
MDECVEEVPMILIACVLMCLLGLLPANATQLSSETVLMRFPYGTVGAAIDTSMIDYDDPVRPVIASYRVLEDESVWLMTAKPGGQVLRHCEAAGDSAIELAHLDLPVQGPFFTDFLLLDGQVILSSLLGSVTEFGRFYLCAGDSLLTWTSHPAGVRTSRGGGRMPARLGRLEAVGSEVYNIDVAYNYSVRIGDGGGLTAITGSSALDGWPMAGGGFVRQSTLQVLNAQGVVLDLPARGEASLRHVFSDGGFVLLRGDVSAADDGTPCHMYQYHDADGDLVRTVVCESYPGALEGVVQGNNYFITADHIYIFIRDVSDARIVKY